MRKGRISLVLLAVAILLAGHAYAYTITFNIGAMGYVLVSETISEGEAYVVPEATLTGLAAAFQLYWDAFEGATMMIPAGALNGDIVVNIQVSNFDLIKGGFLELGEEKVFLSLDSIVEGYEGEAFPFNEGYSMEFTLRLDAEMLPLLQLAGFDLSMPLTLAYWTGSEFVIIPTTQTESKLMGKVPHLSTIVGKKGAPTSVQTSAWGMIKSLFR